MRRGFREALVDGFCQFDVPRLMKVAAAPVANHAFKSGSRRTELWNAQTTSPAQLLT